MYKRQSLYVLQFTRCSFKASQQAAIPSGRFGELWATRFCFASCSLRQGALPSVSLALINRRRCLCREDTGRMERACGMEKRRRSLLKRTLTALWRKRRQMCIRDRDYTGEDGLLYCGKCRKPKEAYFAPDKAAIFGRDATRQSATARAPPARNGKPPKSGADTLTQWKN